MLRRLAMALVLCGCARADDPAKPGGGMVIARAAARASQATAEAPGQTAWISVADGVFHRGAASGADVALVFAGYETTDAHARAWADALFTARLSSMNVRHLYAVRGPDHPQYKGARLPMGALAQHLVANAGPARSIVVAAHSSGSFVAHDLFRKLAHEETTRGKIVYFDLDGAGGGLTREAIESLRHVYFVYAKDGARTSRNADVMRAHARAHGEHCEALAVDAKDSGCAADSKWCLHASLLAARPPDPREVDVERLYAALDRPCVAWLDVLGR